MRAKVRLDNIKRTEYSEDLEFTAVCSDNKEDNSFSSATPSAKFTMSVTNKELFGTMNPGEKYYVDFTKAE